MKAIISTKYGSPDYLRFEEVEKPTPKENEVLIKVRATSINDWDLGLMRGKPYYIRLLAGLRTPKIKIIGVDVAGEVEAVGEQVTKFRKGDRIYGDLSESGFGAFAEYTCANENAIAPMASKMTFEEAAAIPHAAMLAVQGLIDIGQITQGQKILINGAGGGVGTYGIQLAKMFDAEVTGVDTAEKGDMMLSLGFNHVIDYKSEDFTKNGEKYDLILDAKTTRSPFAYAGSLNPGGKYVTVGGTTSRLIQALIFSPIISKFRKKSIRILALKPNKDLGYVNELFEAGKIKSVIDGPFELSQVPEAIQYFSQGKHLGKVIITVKHDS